MFICVVMSVSIRGFHWRNSEAKLIKFITLNLLLMLPLRNFFGSIYLLLGILYFCKSLISSSRSLRWTIYEGLGALQIRKTTRTSLYILFYIPENISPRKRSQAFWYTATSCRSPVTANPVTAYENLYAWLNILLHRLPHTGAHRRTYTYIHTPYTRTHAHVHKYTTSLPLMLIKTPLKNIIFFFCEMVKVHLRNLDRWSFQNEHFKK